MKKTMLFVMLLLSTSVAMAQFGKLEDLGKKQETGEAGSHGDQSNSDSNSSGSFIFGDGQNVRAQILDQTLKNAFMLVSQEYQVEDVSIPGSRYNWGDNQWFGKNTSFLVRLTEGFITTKNIVLPTEDDENFKSLQGEFNPIMNKTSVLRIGDTGWQVENTFQPKSEKELDNGLHYVTDSQWGEGGLHRATGVGKKNVYVVWLEVGEDDPASAKSIRFKPTQTELEIVKDSTVYDLNAPNSNGQIMGGIVVEAITDGMGQLSFALWGVAVKNGDKYQMALLDSDMGKALKPVENTPKPEEKMKKKN